jgi:hypothetical protein
MKTPRRKTKRVLFADAIRRECGPMLFELGFRNPRRLDRDRWRVATRRDVYLRWRGTTFDCLEVSWDRYAIPRCRLYFETSMVEQPSAGGHPAIRSVTPGNLRARSWSVAWISPDYFGRWWHSVDQDLAEIKCSLLAWEAFLQSGTVDWRVWVAPSRRIGFEGDGTSPGWRMRGDPWLDPESDYKPG